MEVFVRKGLFLVGLFLALAAPTMATDVEQRVRFDRGASGTVIHGRLDWSKHKVRRSMRDRYILGASKGQALRVAIKSGPVVRFNVWHKDPDTGMLGSGTKLEPMGSIQLPANGDYYIDVKLEGEDCRYADYDLTVEIK